jgi:hypothetical protein
MRPEQKAGDLAPQIQDAASLWMPCQSPLHEVLADLLPICRHSRGARPFTMEAYDLRHGLSRSATMMVRQVLDERHEQLNTPAMDDLVGMLFKMSALTMRVK